MTFFHDVRSDTLIYPNHALITQVIPEAKVIGQHVAVRRTLRNSQILRHYNFPVVPIVTDVNYNWPRNIRSVPHPYESQKLTTNFLVLHPRSFCLSDMGCVDADTEYLSPVGWKRIADWNGEQVAQYWPERESIDFVTPNEFVKKPCDSMFRFKTTRGVDQLLSPEHRVLLADGSVISALELANSYGSAKRFFHRFRTTFKVEGTRGIALTDAQIRVQVAVNADGSMRASGKTSVRIKKLRKIERMRKLLLEAKIDFVERSCLPKGFVIFYFKPPEPKSNFENWWAATQKQLEIAAQEILYWDGNFAKKGMWRFSSYNRAAADFAQYAFSAFGRRSLLTVNNRKDGNIEYGVGAKAGCSEIGIFGRNEDGSQRQNIWREIPSDGHKYCFVVPSTFLILRRNGCIFATGNTGKTLSMAWAADNLMNWSAEPFRALIVCPRSMLQQWRDQIFEHFLGRRKAVILYGSAEKRRKLLDESADFYIINFDGVGIGAHTRNRLELDGFSKELAERNDIQLAIIDEASAYKDSRTKRHRLARMIFGHKPYLWLATGTPTPNAPTDAYGLAKLVNNAFGKSFTGFQMETMQKVTNFRWVPYKDGYEKARRLLQPAIRFAIEDVWDGPEMTTQQRQIELTPEQTKAMGDLKKDLIVAIKNGAQITAANEAAARSKFIQISLGAIYDSEHKTHYIDASPRLNELLEVVEQAPGKIIIFAPLTSVVEMIYKKLKTVTTAEIVNGNTSQTDRARIFQAFQQGSEPRILVADPGTMAHGLNLWMARTVVWYGPCDKTELYLQANKRAHRPGQKFPVTVIQLVSNKLEGEIFRRLETNTALQGALLAMIKEGLF